MSDTPSTDACLSKFCDWMMKDERADRAHGWNSLAEHARKQERALRAFMDAVHHTQDREAMIAAIRRADALARKALAKPAAAQ